jgi:hypothetical protein
VDPIAQESLINTDVPVVSFTKIGGGFLCSSTSSWSAEYEVTAPKPLFIVSG